MPAAGCSVTEHLIAAMRCLYRHAIADGLIDETANPARRVDKPRRLPSTRRAVADTRLAEINEIAASTGDAPALDSLLLRLHTEITAALRCILRRRPHALIGNRIVCAGDSRDGVQVEEDVVQDLPRLVGWRGSDDQA